MAEIEKMDGKSLDIAQEKRKMLKELFPEVFTEGSKIDFDRLKLTLGEDVDTGKERYGMNWPGKADCFKTIKTPSTGTLLPCREESVEFDNTENLFIEGDNLEVLKILQKSYLGKIKMIYIDPPYNTGNDFIYPDNYTETLDTYLEYTGQVDEHGRRFSTNQDTDGRFHSKWMNMMYPRLFLARYLLREDGVIFISIDDNEVDNLMKICNEIFGEENFVGQLVINSSPSAIDYGHIANCHDYVTIFAKNINELSTSQLVEKDKTFKYEDEGGSFNLYPLYNGNVAFNPDTRPNLFYPFYVNPNNMIDGKFYEISLEKQNGWVEVFPVISRKDGVQRVWRWGKAKSLENLNKEIVGYLNEDLEYRIVQKTRHTSKTIRSLQIDNEVSSRRGTSEVEQLFGRKVFSFPKPTALLKRFAEVGLFNNDIVLDFFSGSCTTAHAVLDLNKEDGGNRKFIMVQLPEPCDENSEAYKAGFKTIADIGKERIRRVINKIKAEKSQPSVDSLINEEKPQDLGFKVFKLSTSNFKKWNKTTEDSEADIAKSLDELLDNIVDDRTQEDILYEILIKNGISPVTKIEKLELAGKSVFVVFNNGMVLICLEDNLTREVIDAMADMNPSKVICLDSAFEGKDELKTNAVLTMKAKDVTKFITV
jgi:adenine-specific DNA-methyltransferase